LAARAISIAIIANGFIIFGVELKLLYDTLADFTCEFIHSRRRAASKFGLMGQSDRSAGNGKDDWAISY
jgi:hypothetical protein